MTTEIKPTTVMDAKPTVDAMIAAATGFFSSSSRSATTALPTLVAPAMPTVQRPARVHSAVTQSVARKLKRATMAIPMLVARATPTVAESAQEQRAAMVSSVLN